MITAVDIFFSNDLLKNEQASWLLFCVPFAKKYKLFIFLFFSIAFWSNRYCVVFGEAILGVQHIGYKVESIKYNVHYQSKYIHVINDYRIVDMSYLSLICLNSHEWMLYNKYINTNRFASSSTIVFIANKTVN